MDSKKDKIQNQNNLSVEVFLGQDNLSVFLFKKTERLVAALFMVGKFLPEKDPISESLKKSGLRLLSNISRTAASHTGWTSQVKQEVKEVIVEIVSTLGVAHIAGFISTMNYNVIVSEFNNVLEFIAKESSTAGISLPKNLFDVGNFTNKEDRISETRDSKGEVYKGHIRHVSYRKDSESPFIKTDNKEKRQGRKTIILDVFKKQGRPLTIKDLTVYVKDCSEKTIQRELVSMVSEGTLRKEGERRWSKYSLISAL